MVLRDENANEQLFFSTTSSAVNYLNVTNAATGNDPKLSALGDDSNIDLAISPKGTGEVVVGTGAVCNSYFKWCIRFSFRYKWWYKLWYITITDGANGNITVTPNGTGLLKLVVIQMLELST